MARQLTWQRVVGALGEVFAESYLRDRGFRICRADEIHFVGHSWLSPSSLPEFDCQNLRMLAPLCADLMRCDVRGQPCRDPYSSFYSPNPNPDNSFAANTGDDRFRYHCAAKMSYLAMLGRCSSVCSLERCAIRSYLQIDCYIQNLYSYRPEVPYPSDIAGRRYWHNWWDGHPGRIDLFGCREGELYCLEVKVNTSRRSKWQVIRLNWMKEHGSHSGIAHVHARVRDREQLVDLYRQSRIAEALTLLSPRCTLEGFRLSDYERYEKFIPTPEAVASYIAKGYGFARIDWL